MANYPLTISINEAAIFTALRNFLLSIMPSNVECFRSVVNRVAEPTGSDFIAMTPLFQERLMINIDEYNDNFFVGSITGTVLDITEVISGALGVGSYIYGVSVAQGTYISALGTGSGGIGTYTVNNSQNVASEALQAGLKTSMQSTQVTVQLDVHGPASANNAQIISTLFRDEYASIQFSASGYDISPLYTSDPHQMLFMNGEQQMEERWILDVVLQVNPVIALPQQFAVALGPAIINDVI